MDDYESSPTMKYEGSGEAVADDNHSEKTGSEGSEGFIKVDEVIDEQDQHSSASQKPAVAKQPEPETIPQQDTEQKKNSLESAMNECLDPKVVDLLFWRDVRLSAVIFTLTMLVLLSLQCFSVVSVVAYLGLSLLTVTVSFRLFKFVLQTLNGTQQPNPFQQLLDADITISAEQATRYTDAMLVHVNHIMTSTRDLVLVKNALSSLKFGLMMWLLTYVGGWFNGLTLLTVDVALMFSLPPIYEKYQEPIDTYYGKASKKLDDVMALIKSKLPGSKPKTQ